MISPADVAFFETHGWFVTPPIVPDILLDRARAGLADHWAGHRDWVLPASSGYSDWMPGAGPGTRNNEYLSLQNGDVRALATFPPIGDLAAALLRDSFVRLFDDQMVCKPPSASSAVGWHVDADYWATCDAHEMITAWIPLDDCPIELGPLVVVDASHRGPRPAPPGTLSFHKQDMNHSSFASTDALVPMTLKRGQVSFHHGRALHGSYPNTGRRPRVAFAIHMQSSRNRYRAALHPDGTPVRLFNDCLCARDATGLPDYADGRVFPRLGSGAVRVTADSFPLAAARQWHAALAGVPHDVYHTLGYHALAEQMGEGTARLFVFREGGYTFAFPFLLRPIPGDSARFDATSVYGYPGPVASPGAPPGFLQRASSALRQSWVDARIVSAFTRFNPLLANDRLMPEWQAHSFVVHPGHSVSMDLRLSPELQHAHYPKTVRQEIAAARRRGLTTTEDSAWQDAAAFVALYNGAMRARSAPPSYLLSPGWVQAIRHHLKGIAHLLCTRLDTHVVAAICVLEHDGIFHAHLTGVDPAFAPASPLKLLLDDVGRWCRHRGASTFHLGGGIGGKQDSLFEFKRRLSSRQHRFAFGGWIVDKSRFDVLTAHAAPPLGQGFFPPYRDLAAIRQQQLTLTAK